MDAVALLFALRRAADIVGRVVETDAPRGLSFTAQLVLFAVEAAPGIRTVELAAQLGHAKSNVKAYLSLLETNGLVRRQWLSRREVRLHPTAAGRRTAAELRENLAGWAGLLWGDLPPDDLAALARILTRIQERGR